jgi:kinesin family protein 5
LTEDSGYRYPAPGSQYTDQKKAWDLLGNGMLDKAWKGLNVTMFAYGQTGSGKSYTMFGSPGNDGIVPMAANQLFKRIESN